MATTGNFVCGISGQEVMPGDQYVIQEVPAEGKQAAYKRLVLLKHLNLSEEQIAELVAKDMIKTAE